MLLFFGVPANVCQYIVTGPNFGGLSAVEFGMLSFIWSYGVLNPQSHINMPFYIVAFLLGYFVLSWFGIFGQMSNIAHTVGLICGIVAGFIVGKKHPTQ
jgi:GlpG protein